MKLSPAGRRLLLVVALLGWSVSLVLYRIHLAPGGGKNGVGLLWNLFLAAIPLVWSAAFRASSARKRPVLAALCFALWMLFLPNAPYLLTDVIHLAPRPPVPRWYVSAMLLSCVATGTLLGYLSLLEVHATIEGSLGALAGWLIVFGSLLSCGFGIYLGRFLRWNSWDALTCPLDLARSIIWEFRHAGGPHPSLIAVTLVYGGGLIIGYAALRVIATSTRSLTRSAAKYEVQKEISDY